MKKLRIGSKIKIKQSSRRRLNSFYIGKTGTVIKYMTNTTVPRFVGKIKVRMDTDGAKLHWYPEEMQPLKQFKLKQFSAWK